jgi:hypothetical protein
MTLKTRQLALLPFLILLLLPQCSKSTLTVNVDILSFFEEEDKEMEYGENPVIPGYGPEISVKSPIQVISIPEEMSSNGTIEEIFILFGLDVANQTGQAEANFRVYACEKDLNPFLTPPILAEELILEPDSSYLLEMTVEGDDRLHQLFTKEEIYFAVEVFLQPGESTEDIKGVMLMEELKALVAVSSSF